MLPTPGVVAWVAAAVSHRAAAVSHVLLLPLTGPPHVLAVVDLGCGPPPRARAIQAAEQPGRNGQADTAQRHDNLRATYLVLSAQICK